MQESRFHAADGTEIFTRSWPPVGSARAIVVLVHGFNSHGGQYTWVASRLAAAGFLVHALDLRGRGQSQGERFLFTDVTPCVADIATLVRRARSAHCGLPVFLLGHSAGGVLACSYALDHQQELAGLVCESFAYRVPAPAWVLGLVKLVARVAPRLRVLRLRNRDFSRDPAAVAVLEADPLIAGEAQPAATIAAMVRANERLEREFARIVLPVLILHGTADRATLAQGSRLFHARAGARDKTLRLYDGHYHDLLNDLGREQVLADIRAWIEARLERGGSTEDARQGTDSPCADARRRPAPHRHENGLA